MKQKLPTSWSEMSHEQRMRTLARWQAENDRADKIFHGLFWGAVWLILASALAWQFFHVLSD